MKPIFFTLIFVFGFILNSKGQVILEATYDSASTNLYMINLEISGQKYVKVTKTVNNRFIYLFNLDHSPWKTIDCNSFPFVTHPMSGPIYNFSVLYITESLFDNDNGLEFLFTLSNSPGEYTGIYNEDGTIIFSQNGAYPGVTLNIPIVNVPIYNTPSGTKLILSFPYTLEAKVYSLQGTLSTPELINNSVFDESLNIFPNPTSGSTTIEYTLPKNTTTGNIEIYDLNGKFIKSYLVENTRKNIIINNGEIPSGTYIYNLNASGNILESRKIIIIK